MDAIIIVTLVSAISSLILSLGTMIRHSECGKGCFKCDTRSPSGTPKIIDLQPSIRTPLLMKS